MKTYNYIILTVFLFISIETIGQNQSWPSPGAVWYYVNNGTDINCKYIKMYADYDTIVQYHDSFMVAKLMRLEYLDSNLNFLGDSSFVAISGNGGKDIYRWGFYAYKGVRLFPLYKNVNETTVDNLYKDTALHVSYSVAFIPKGSELINGKEFKKFYHYIMGNTCFKFRDYYFEIIGSLNYFLFYDTCNSFGYAGKLSCYFDSTLGVFNTGIEEKCICEKIGLGINDEPNHNKAAVIVYPNPGSSIVKFQIPKNTYLIEYKLFDINGRELRWKSGNEISTHINLNDFQGNLFILKIITSSGTSIQKLIKSQ